MAEYYDPAFPTEDDDDDTAAKAMKGTEKDAESADAQQISENLVDSKHESIEASVVCENVSLTEVNAQEIIETATIEEISHTELQLESKSIDPFDTVQLTVTANEVVFSDDVSSDPILLSNNVVSSLSVDVNESESVIESNFHSRTVIENLDLERLSTNEPVEIQVNCVHLTGNVPELLREEETIEIETMQVDALEITNTIEIQGDRIDITKDNLSSECTSLSEINKNLSDRKRSNISRKKNNSRLRLHDAATSKLPDEMTLELEKSKNNIIISTEKKIVTRHRSRLTKQHGKPSTDVCQKEEELDIITDNKLSKQCNKNKLSANKITKSKPQTSVKKKKSKTLIVVTPSRRSARNRGNSNTNEKLNENDKIIEVTIESEITKIEPEVPQIKEVTLVMEEKLLDKVIEEKVSEILNITSSDLIDTSVNQSRNRKNRRQKKTLTESRENLENIDNENGPTTRRRSTRIKSLEERKGKEKEIKDKEPLEKKEKIIEKDKTKDIEKRKTEKLIEEPMEVDSESIPLGKKGGASKIFLNKIKFETSINEKRDIASSIHLAPIDEPIITKPEKVKSRWRRSSEMDNFGGDIIPKTEMKLQEIVEETVIETALEILPKTNAVVTTSTTVISSSAPTNVLQQHAPSTVSSPLSLPPQINLPPPLSLSIILGVS